jgi:hypothetical protein
MSLVATSAQAGAVLPSTALESDSSIGVNG